MSRASAAPPPTPPLARPVAIPVESSIWSRFTNWASENKALVYTIAGVAVVVTSAGVVYYLNDAKPKVAAQPKLSKKERRKRKEAERQAEPTQSPTTSGEQSKAPTVEAADELPEINETTVATFTDEQRRDYALQLKNSGNKAYGSKDYNRAIDLYSKAILCKPDSIFYSNRAACYNALSVWDKVVEDTTAAISLDPTYVKALNRRANAYEHLSQFSESLLDYTASCIIDEFKTDSSTNAVERLLKKVAEQKAEDIIKSKDPNKLPSPTFVSNYIQSFRSKSRPEGLEDDVELSESTGLGQLQIGLKAMEKKTHEGYEEAANAFEKALEYDDLGEHEALAYNLRGTFRNLRGSQEQALRDMDKSIELDPTYTQSYVKRASMHLEMGDRNSAAADLEQALSQNDTDPDIFYHRAQLHFIHGEFQDAAKDYQKSIDLDPSFIFSHIQLGVTQYKMGSVASSMATFRRCVKNFDSVPDVYNYYGELLLDQSKYEEAIQKFDTAMEMEKQTKPMAMNVLPLINKALALFQQTMEFSEAEKLCEKALIIDPECDIAVATMAQLLLQQGKITEALQYFERAAELARTPGEIVNALSYAEATRTQIQVQEKYPQLAAKLQGMGAGAGGMGATFAGAR
ncbi:mitochondrial outer membrane 72K protein [Annulohypoxylon maeteangense]|uniref:mitochondrial outer membrane 72K protein n=1 Tax=Annulohypoxylon maeteangense TaxID=1927788 RepID=UPI0020073FF0|nr:mitochondrial outer membrane 72K protein [Annulohypoxylon maeteangense]KAI0885680.1 mitochondrial outer membrane 72K protein [Annulohypoxylon maeteangense]